MKLCRFVSNDDYKDLLKTVDSAIDVCRAADDKYSEGWNISYNLSEIHKCLEQIKSLLESED